MGQGLQGVAQLVALVVDDHPICRHLLSMRLRQIGLRVIEADDAAEALDIVDHVHVDLVLLDCDMPLLDGGDCARALRGTGFAGYILGVSAHGSEDRTSAALGAGMDAVSAKHLPREALASALLRAQRRKARAQGGAPHHRTLLPQAQERTAAADETRRSCHA